MWFYAALGTAFISGIYTVTSKHALKNIDPVIFFWVVLAVSTPIVWLFTIKDGIPSLSYIFALGIAGSIIPWTISKIIFWRTVKESSLSHVYPLISIGPVFTLLFSIIILSEKLSWWGFVGSGITLLGTYVLNVSSIREGLLEPFKILFRNKLALWMLASVLIGSIVSVFDKIAINNTFPHNALFTLLIEDLAIIICLLPLVIAKRKEAVPQIKNNIKIIVGLGILGAASNILGMTAIGAGNPGLVASVFRTQVFFVLLFSFLFFGDRPKTETIIGSIIMILGLVVLKLFS